MVKGFYEVVDAGSIIHWRKTEVFTKVDLQDEITDINTILALSDEEKQLIAGYCGSVEALNTMLTARRNNLQDIVDYWDYDTEGLNFTAAKGELITPIAINSKCGEEAGDEAVNCIDGNIATYWRCDTDERHWIIFDLGYPKMIKQILIWLNAGDGDQHKLEEVNVHVGDDLNNMTQVGTDLDFQTLDSWNPQDLTPIPGRYIKLDNIYTLDGTHRLRLREIQFYVKTMDEE